MKYKDNDIQTMGYDLGSTFSSIVDYISTNENARLTGNEIKVKSRSKIVSSNNIQENHKFYF